MLAAAGLVALDGMIDRLADDHANARRLAQGLAELPGLEVDLESVQSNIIMFTLTSTGWPAESFLQAMQAKGVKFSSVAGRQFRLVTHYGVESADIERALDVFRSVLSAGA